MAQPLQHPHRIVVVDRNGEPRPRVVYPDPARSYAADRIIDEAAERQRDLEDLLRNARQAAQR